MYGFLVDATLFCYHIYWRDWYIVRLEQGFIHKSKSFSGDFSVKLKQDFTSDNVYLRSKGKPQILIARPRSLPRQTNYLISQKPNFYSTRSLKTAQRYITNEGTSTAKEETGTTRRTWRTEMRTLRRRRVRRAAATALQES